MHQYWSRYQQSISNSLAGTIVTDQAGKVLEADSAFDLLSEWTKHASGNGRSIRFIGNGASACMASHMAVDWTKNGGVRASAYNDLAFLTAIGNDIGYDEVFSNTVRWFAEPGDILATISSSGNSKNILNAIRSARELDLRVVTFSGMKPDNGSRSAGDLNFYVPGWSYGIIECCHQVLLHTWIDGYMKVKEWELKSPQTFTPPVYSPRNGHELVQPA